MNVFGLIFTFIVSAMLFRAPRNMAVLPLLIGAVYITKAQQLEIGPLHFSTMRVLIAVGLLRASSKQERMVGGINSLDKIGILWMIWNLCTIPFHQPDVMIFRLGILFDIVGAYYLFRVFLTSLDDIRTVFKIVCLLFVPLAATMLVERFTGFNLLSLFEFAPSEVMLTNGHFRAQGAFAHAILAGTVGAVCLPMAVYYWRENRKLAIKGLAATLAIVFASGSSGPVMSTLSVSGALTLWNLRGHIRAIRMFALAVIVALNFLMNDPIYFLMARIDITGGSTGYFRAQLIQSALNHLSEWWLVGTDHTRHWMESGIYANSNHTDMTNYYLQMGVWGGLVLMSLFVWMIVASFMRVSKSLHVHRRSPLRDQFLIWVLGSILFGHATTFWSISYFDQSIVFLCLLFAAIGSLPLRRRIDGTNSSWQTPVQQLQPTSL
jgi:hypothetical protein